MINPLSFFHVKTAVLRDVVIEGNTTKVSPPTNKKWWILYGMFKHTNLTDSMANIYNDITAQVIFGRLGRVLAATASGVYPLISRKDTACDAHTPDNANQTFIVEDSDFIQLFGGAAVELRLVVLEFELQ